MADRCTVDFNNCNWHTAVGSALARGSDARPRVTWASSNTFEASMMLRTFGPMGRDATVGGC